MEINKMVFIFSSFALFNCCTQPTANSSSKVQSEQKRVQAKTDTTYIKTIDYFEESSQGGMITYEVRNGNLMKVKIDLYGEMGNVTRVMTLDHDQVSTYNEIIRNYDRPIGNPMKFSVVDSTSIQIEIDSNNNVKTISQKGKQMDSVDLKSIVRNIDTRKDKYLTIFRGLL